MVNFQLYESSAAITHNGVLYSLTEAEVDNLFWQTADLVDENHNGSAAIELNGKTVVMTEDEWLTAFEGADKYMTRAIEALTMEPLH